MKTQNKDLLLPFYFGSIDEKNRLLVERELIVDEELLIDFLDLKRKLEQSLLPQEKPSEGLWYKVKPQTKKQKMWISLSLGAVAASLFAFSLFFQTKESSFEFEQPSVNGALFDSSSEHFASSGVL